MHVPPTLLASSLAGNSVGVSPELQTAVDLSHDTPAVNGGLVATSAAPTDQAQQTPAEFVATSSAAAGQAQQRSAELVASSAAPAGQAQSSSAAMLLLPMPSEVSLVPRQRPAGNFRDRMMTEPHDDPNQQSPSPSQPCKQSESSDHRLPDTDAVRSLCQQPRSMATSPASRAESGPNHTQILDTAGGSEPQPKRLTDAPTAVASSNEPDASAVQHEQVAQVLPTSSPFQASQLPSRAQGLSAMEAAKQPPKGEASRISIPAESNDSCLDLLRAQIYASNAADFYSRSPSTQSEKSAGQGLQKDLQNVNGEAGVSPKSTQGLSDAAACSDEQTSKLQPTSNVPSAEASLRDLISRSAAAAISCLLQEESSVLLHESPMAFITPAPAKDAESALVGA
jgi:hypothetical protein